MKCPICSNPTYLYYFHTKHSKQHYYRCIDCHSVAMHPKYYLTREEEKARYLTHNNDVEDPRYQKFVHPVVQAVTNRVKEGCHGLDYGAGTGPVVTKMLREKGYKMTTYDPLFIPNIDALNTTYDFIVCCEVVEHFHQVQREFTQFYQLLKSSGLLIIKTELLSSDIDFPSWYYIKDPTHTLLYSPKGMSILLKKYCFKSIKLTQRLIVAKKS